MVHSGIAQSTGEVQHRYRDLELVHVHLEALSDVLEAALVVVVVVVAHHVRYHLPRIALQGIREVRAD